MEPMAQVLSFLDAHGISFDLRPHAPVFTMADCAALGLPAPHCKNLLLCNRAGMAHTLLLLPAQKPFRTREASQVLGCSRLSFAGEEAVRRLLHTVPGAVSPMGLIFPEAAGVRLACDRDLLALPKIAFHPLTRDASLLMRTEDFFGRFLPAAGREPVLISLS
jgi:Ala-tRNA(Pro) deacylase